VASPSAAGRGARLRQSRSSASSSATCCTHNRTDNHTTQGHWGRAVLTEHTGPR
jgi:hypothetical protein